jgi:NAD(P)H-hydrate epimerase
VITAINGSGHRVFAVDLPSGLDCDLGQPLGCCVRADHTATFVARKPGFDVTDADKWTGMVHVIDIGVPNVLLRQIALG